MFFQCPVCGGLLSYVGVGDGGGDYGTSICDIYDCVSCGYSGERNCIDMMVDDVHESEVPISDED